MKNINDTLIKPVLYLGLLTGISWLTYWWVVPVFTFIVGYLFFQSGRKAFIFHFLMLFVLWAVVSYFKDGQVDGAVATFLSSLAGEIPPGLMYLITGLTGGLFAGWAAYLGVLLRKIVSVNKPLR
jgi:hypothetical protein